jgi:hypothetical protein
MFLMATVAITAVACGSNGDDAASETSKGDQSGAAFSTELRDDSVTRNGIAPAGGFGFPPTAGATATPAPPRPAPTSVSGPAGFPGSPGFDEESNSVGDTDLPALPQEPLEQPQTQVGQQRIIVRNVNMTIEAEDIASAIDQIGRLATQTGGWIVSTQNNAAHRGSIDIRVPADRLDETLTSLRDIASKVTFESSSSQDFTEEFTDTTARIQTLQDTVDALRVLFERAVEIEDALNIQREITRVQSDIEAKQARINFLSESAAFSLVRVEVLALPQEMVIDAGEDMLAAVGRVIRFRAEFTPPEGVEDFWIVWDFGDGSEKRSVNTVSPVDESGRVISAPVLHVYGDDTDSPYIVSVEVTGTGESGAAEGEDVLVVTVNRVPPIEVFAGDNQTVDEGDNVKLRGSFTRPEGVENLTYTWDFGDGSSPVTVDADPNTTLAEIEHRFANSRPQPYNVVLTVEGETSVGTWNDRGFRADAGACD